MRNPYKCGFRCTEHDRMSLRREVEGLPDRGHNILYHCGYHTRASIAAETDEELLDLMFIGVGTLAKIREKIPFDASADLDLVGWCSG